MALPPRWEVSFDNSFKWSGEGEKKKKDFHYFCFYKNTCVILFMVNLN